MVDWVQQVYQDNWIEIERSFQQMILIQLDKHTSEVDSHHTARTKFNSKWTIDQMWE